MSEEILINVTPRETRVAVVENGMLQEVHVERALRRGYVGNIYKGRVSRVMPGMQAAFVEIGLERAAFLHASDIVRAIPALAVEGAENGNSAQLPISELVHEGQEIIVQVVKDPIGGKGARLTTHLSVPSRYLVLLPYAKVVGVSVRIEDETERTRLKDIMQALAAETTLGYIVRTNAEGQSRESLSEDVAYLGKLWHSLQDGIVHAQVGARVYEDLSLPLRALRDLMRSAVEKVRVDSRECYERTTDFARQFMPELAERIEHYPGERPIFDLYGVEDEIQRALKKQVPLKSGGYLVIDQTEAMTTIDVNTGAFLGHRNLEETVYKTNLEAAQAAARQLRLRNLGGIIIIDFIDMEDEAHRAQLLDALRTALAADRAQTQIAEGAPLGLVAMTRKRTRESLEHLLCEPCQDCEGRGFVRSIETICHEIYREGLRQGAQLQVKEMVILAHPEVVERLLDEEAPVLADLELRVGKPIRLQSDALYSIDQYDIVLA